MAASKSKQGNPDKRKATTKPVSKASELVGSWDREFDLKDGYRGLTVEVISRENNVLSFRVLDGEGKGSKKAFTINLDDGMEAWASLPSTAQNVDPESSQRIGYLFVTKQWLGRNKTGILAPTEPPKWPKVFSL